MLQVMTQELVHARVCVFQFQSDGMFELPVPKIDFISGHSSTPEWPFNQRDPRI